MHLGRVSIVVIGYESNPASAEFPHHPDVARESAAAWSREPHHAPGISITWEWVAADGTTLVLMWDRGRTAEFILPAS